MADIYAEWEKMDGVLDEEGNVKEKPTIKLTPESILRILKRINDEDITFMGFSPVWS